MVTQAPRDGSSERALLVCAGGGIGDSLVASVVGRALRSRYSAVDALTLPSHRSTLERVPDFDRVYEDDGRDEREIAAMLEPARYAAAVVTWATARTARVPQLAGIPIRVGQARRLYSHRFTHRVTVRSEVGDVTSHWSQILLDYARAIGCDTADTYPRFVPTADDEREADALLDSLRLAAGDFAIVHPTNAIAPARGIWPTQGWSALVRALRDRFDVPVVVSGSSDDAAIAGEIAREGGGTSIAGRTSMGAFAATARRARVFAGITTGSMHVAAAVGCPTAGIFPFQTDTPERWAPLGQRTAIVRASYPCRSGERKESCPDYACIAHLDVPRILAAVEALVQQYAPS
ncbi:MAG: glycosyltransferase family 9 protein [Vulcanimicrobiaceae bacterium]